MKGLQLAVVLVCVNLVSLWALPAGEDGQWIDDVSNNPEVMGFDKETRSKDEAVAVPDSISSNVQVEDDGEWVDDVTGNQIVMGEDPLSQDSGLSETQTNDERKRRSVGKKILKKLKKVLGK